MRVTILGSGTAVPSLDRNSSCILIQNSGINSLVDFGYGTLHQLLKLGLTYHDIDRVYFTHNHPDHMCDLIMFLFGSRYGVDPRTRDLEIVGGPGFGDFFDGLMKVFKRWLVPTDYEITLTEQDEETREYDGLQVMTRKVRHIAMSRGYRITDPQTGKSVAVSGDTDTCDGMIELARGADLMILECAWPDDLKTDGHLGPTTAAQMAEQAQCKTLCLTHFYPPCDLDNIREVASTHYQGSLVLAEDLMQFDL